MRKEYDEKLRTIILDNGYDSIIYKNNFEGGGDSLIVFNNTKVIPARIQLQKQSGTAIEIFLLKPLIDNVPTQQAMEQSREIRWECLIGNKKRWKHKAIEQQKKKGFLTPTK